MGVHRGAVHGYGGEVDEAVLVAQGEYLYEQ